MKTYDFTNVTAALKARGFSVSCFDTAKEAAAYLDGCIDRTTVGFGGSVTLEQMGLYEKLSAHNRVFWHARIPEGETAMSMRLAANSAEVYLSSVNGLAETGEIINIDGTCNRVASIFFGHKKVYLAVGGNKLAKDYESALWRARNIAAPRNARRLGRKTPCAVEGGVCHDCKSTDRICCGLSVLWCPPMGSDLEILLIGEELGY